MESARLPWRALRPLLLAGAAASVWLALSAPAASADSTADPGSLLGGISSSVSSIADKAAAPVDALASAVNVADPITTPAPPAAARPAQPAAPEQLGLLQPATTITRTGDHLIEVVPVVAQIVPAGAVNTVTTPVAAAADTIVADAADAVIPAAGDAVPVLEPILEPVEEVLAGIDALPIPESKVLDPSPAAVPNISTFDGGLTTGVEPAVGGSGQASLVTSGPTVVTESAQPMHSARTAPAQLSAQPHSPAPPGGSLESPGNGEAAPVPHDPPAVPGSGSGGGQSSGGGSGGSAWLSVFHLDTPLTGVFSISGPLQSAPAPVSFDPGSSPD
ncbi:hypothetical protein [Arthrobacter sp. ISL-72]|uniref:hypothetical protein n=1 Tax=Arthrobacter sp. ISL-72 TaxID=2819114 RepID=UPI001BECB829|nr:hypothetical protein [Arthrobacter sp. ISL-72]MBT2595642.1 hypothetical protein [Arthrobacter sp. ISL-72]